MPNLRWEEPFCVVLWVGPRESVGFAKYPQAGKQTSAGGIPAQGTGSIPVAVGDEKLAERYKTSDYYGLSRVRVVDDRNWIWGTRKHLQVVSSTLLQKYSHATLIFWLGEWTTATRIIETAMTITVKEKTAIKISFFRIGSRTRQTIVLGSERTVILSDQTTRSVECMLTYLGSP